MAAIGRPIDDASALSRSGSEGLAARSNTREIRHGVHFVEAALLRLLTIVTYTTGADSAPGRYFGWYLRSPDTDWPQKGVV